MYSMNWEVCIELGSQRVFNGLHWLRHSIKKCIPWIERIDFDWESKSSLWINWMKSRLDLVIWKVWLEQVIQFGKC